MGNENTYNIVLKHSEARELQLALLYHLDNVLIPYYEEKAEHWDYYPTREIQAKINRLQGILKQLNVAAGEYRETEF